MIFLFFFSQILNAAPIAISCSGTKANTPGVKYSIVVDQYKNNAVQVTDFAKNQKCSCQFKFSNLIDQAKGVVPTRHFTLTYQACDEKCPIALKKMMNAELKITQNVRTGDLKTTPFVGNETSKCDKYSIDMPAIRNLELKSIADMDAPVEVKNRIRALKGLTKTRN